MSEPKYRATQRYSFGWTDPRALFGSTEPVPLRPMQWECRYCRSRHTVTIDKCPNCGAPK